MSTTAQGLRAIDAFREAEASGIAGSRLDGIRHAAPRFRERFVAEGAPLAVRTLELVTFPYPQSYGFQGASWHPGPYVALTARSHLVRYRDWGGVERLLLFNPTDADGARRAPFFAEQIERYGAFLAGRVFSRQHATVEQELARLQVRPEEIDYLSFDHLHVQDVRRWLGTTGSTPGRDGALSAFFPRAKLLVQRRELAGARQLHPLQQHWYVPGGVAGVPAERVIELDGDVSLGPGVALLSTPGHTFGNHSLCLHVGEGRVNCFSENGVSADCWSPSASKIPGLASFARRYHVEVVMNANTLEGSLDQYTSMVKEKLVAGPAPHDGDFADVVPTSEFTYTPLVPGVRPTHEHRPLHFGALGAGSGRSAG